MSDATPPHYGSPVAFRRALTDRLKTPASEVAGRWHSFSQIAYDRLLGTAVPRR